MSAATAAGPPLAQTCHGSRRSPFASEISTFGSGSSRATRLLDTKKAASTAAPGHPTPARMVAPISAAETAPPGVSVPARQATAAARMETALAVNRLTARSARARIRVGLERGQDLLPKSLRTTLSPHPGFDQGKKVPLELRVL